MLVKGLFLIGKKLKNPIDFGPKDSIKIIVAISNQNDKMNVATFLNSMRLVQNKDYFFFF